MEKELRALKAMIHYDACGPESFRMPEEIASDIRTFTERCMRAH